MRTGVHVPNQGKIHHLNSVPATVGAARGRGTKRGGLMAQSHSTHARNPRRSGPNNPNWKGGRTITEHGYVLVRRPDHPDADVRGYIYEHRLIAEQMIGRRLLSEEQVHHRDGDKQNNDPSNLEVCDDNAHHHFEHRRRSNGLRVPGEPNPVVQCDCGCGTVFRRFDDFNRPRRFVPGHNPQDAPTEKAVLDALASGPLHRAEVIRRTGLSFHAAVVSLSKLKRRGLTINTGRGVWKAVA